MSSTIPLSIRLATPNDRASWDAYVLNHPDGLAYQLFAWKEAVEGAYGFECPYFLAEAEGTLCGVFPLAHIHLPLCKGTLVSLPYCDAGGILADSDGVRGRLLEQALDYATERGISNVEIRSVVPIGMDDEKTRHPSKVRMLLSLPGDSETLLAGFKSKLRSQVKKPSKDGLRSRLGGVELLDVFYPLFAENMRDLGSPVHSREWLRCVLERYGEHARCCIVTMPDGEPAAGGLILCHPQTVSVPWASSLRRLNRWNPNMLLYWSFLEYAADQGHAAFDFGRSTPEEGTYRFKAQWGAKPQPLHWACSNTSHTQNNADPTKPVSPGATQGFGREAAERVIQRMPLFISQLVGTRLRRYITL
ncbi:MAG: FemAB family PEP-CTERM system-associated protein [Desulfobacteraceae bacterium]|jgi:FemAB-related protein (PEP-CTERM system-associated)